MYNFFDILSKEFCRNPKHVIDDAVSLRLCFDDLILFMYCFIKTNVDPFVIKEKFLEDKNCFPIELLTSKLTFIKSEVAKPENVELLNTYFTD